MRVADDRRRFDKCHPSPRRDGALAAGWLRYLLASAAVIAHAISNLPMTPFWQGVIVAALVVGAVVAVRRGTTVVRQVFSDATVVGCVLLGVVGTGYAIASDRVGGLVFVAAAMVVLAVVLEAVDRRRGRAAGPLGSTGVTQRRAGLFQNEEARNH